MSFLQAVDRSRRQPGDIDTPRREPQSGRDVLTLKIWKIRQDCLDAHPSASISRMSLTRMRMPRMQGRPPHCAGLKVRRMSSEGWF